MWFSNIWKFCLQPIRVFRNCQIFHVFNVLTFQRFKVSDAELFKFEIFRSKISVLSISSISWIKNWRNSILTRFRFLFFSFNVKCYCPRRVTLERDMKMAGHRAMFRKPCDTIYFVSSSLYVTEFKIDLVFHNSTWSYIPGTRGSRCVSVETRKKRYSTRVTIVSLQ